MAKRKKKVAPFNRLNFAEWIGGLQRSEEPKA